MREFIRSNHRIIEWLLGLVVIVSSLAVWLVEREPDFASLTIYEIFPPLGLLAFGLMWTHFVMGALRRYAGVEKGGGGMYMALSMGVVLSLIILHPLLLWIGLYSDGYGLPPGSHIAAYQSQLLYVGLGTIGLVIFLSYELKRFFGEKGWWKYIEWIQIVGMVAIFVHAIGLGSELRLDWFMAVWVLYGITLAVAVGYSRFIYRNKEVENER